jgi:sn-glycerol 3-phosphate transport system substrate-binding protein
MGGKKPEEYKGVANSSRSSRHQPAAKLHQESGYLPITKAAYEKTKADGFYEKNPVPETPLKELTNKEPTRIRAACALATWCRCAISGPRKSKRARRAKDRAGSARCARSRGNAMLRTFEKTAK